MNTHSEKTEENKSQSVSSVVFQMQSRGESTHQFVDNRPEAIAQKKIAEMANNSPQAKQAAQLQAMADNYSAQQHPIQKKASPEQARRENNTGLPDNLKTEIENLSGYSMDYVKVHYNSSNPAQLQAHAYAQGTDIHIAPCQEKHLPHEAWHVVQQKQGRVKPTMQMKDKVNVNDDAGLEKEADMMGAKALQTNRSGKKSYGHPIYEKIQTANSESSQLTQFTVQEAIDLARIFVPLIANQINSWEDITRHKYFFTPEQRSQLRTAANNNSGSAQVRSAWVETDTPRTYLLNDDYAVSSMVKQVLNTITRTIRERGPGFVTTQVLRQIPYVRFLLDANDVVDDLAALGTAVQAGDGGRAVTAASSVISTLFGIDRLGYAATGLEAVRGRATNYVMTTGAYKTGIGKIN